MWGSRRRGPHALLTVVLAGVSSSPSWAGDEPASEAAAREAGEAPGAAQRAKIETLRQEAALELARSNWTRARELYDQLLTISRHDAAAQRDAGRAGMAASDFEYAARVLEQAHHFAGHHRDPELHYLRGEALYALGRLDEARGEHRIAELEIGASPSERMPRLWLARVYARRGELRRADQVYERMWPAADAPADAEVAINHADAHLLWQDWAGAERLLRRFLARSPDNLRARHMLAWALEAEGKLPDELTVRSRLAADDPSMGAQRDYGRALERAGEYADALRAYRSASAAGEPDATLVAARDRMRYRLTPEVTGGIGLRSDPNTNAERAQAGAALPFGSRHLVSMLFSHDAAQGGWPNARTSVSAVTAALVLGARYGGTLMFGAQARGLTQIPSSDGAPLQSQAGLRFGGIGEIDTPVGSRVRVNVRGGLEEQWTEAAIAIRENGVVTGATGQLFVFPVPSTRRVILVGGSQPRRLMLGAGAPGAARPEASQVLSWAGADLVVWQDPGRVLRGQVLNDSLVRATESAEAVSFSARHYELYGQSDPEFDRRLSLLPRSSVTIGSVVMRSAAGDGRYGVELRGGLGYESMRRNLLSQGGLTLSLASSAASRILASYDFAQETMTGLVGRRHTGWVAYHVDL